MWCIPPEQSADFVWKMEDVLGVYHLPYDPAHPVVCLDEKSVQLIADTRTPLPPEPGRIARPDHEYERKGTANLFVAFEPLANWRKIEVTDHRTRSDFAHFVRGLLDGRYKEVQRVVLVMDNLNTHTPASLYDAFVPEEAERLAKRLEIHYTPKHGSWMNIAEIELSALGRCLPGRIPDNDSLKKHMAAAERDRNNAAATVNWQFTTADARIKLKRLYPTIEVR